MAEPSIPIAEAIEPAWAWPRRYTIVVLFALATALCYVDRVNISIAIIPLARARGYDSAKQGQIGRASCRETV